MGPSGDHKGPDNEGWGRGVVLAIGLLVVLLVAGGLVISGAQAARSTPATSDVRAVRLTTPVLSARRVPELVSRTVAHIRLGDELDAALTSSAGGRATESSCLSVEEGDAMIYGRRSDQKLVPASTLKVLTGLSAVARLGADFRFVTEVRTNVPVVDGILDGPLWLVGAGDPLLSSKAYADSFRNQPQVYTSIDALADRIAAAGIREIRGGLIGDDSRFDSVRYYPTWKSAYITDNEIGPVGALVVNDNFSQFRPLKMIAATAPATNGAGVLTELLRGRGLIVADPSEGAVPEGATAVASIESPPVPEIVGELLRESDNMTAEVLTKELGKRYGKGGTWAEGTRVIKETVAKAGLDADGYAAVDGSGLDLSDRLSCTLLMDALDLVGRDSPVTAGFAVAGQTGTLAQRFKGSPAEGRLRAKTGSLNNVAGLVGYVDAGDDRTLEFALLANDLPDRNDSGRALQERVGAALARYPQAPPAANLEPLAPTRGKPRAPAG